MTSKPSAPERADWSAWLAVIAGALGALMATFDISIVNSSLPTIQGEIGATGSEGTWVATAYLVAEIIIIPLSAWCSRVLGLRTFLLSAATLFTGFSVLCGCSTTLVMMIVGRIGQGITGGALIPTAMTIIATRLPRRQQPIGNSIFGAVVILGPVIGPLLGGWLTENVSWHYAFFLNIPICALLVATLLATMPHQPMKLELLREADWLGIAGLALGLGGLTVVLEEGQRELWFSSPLICALAGVSLLGFVLLWIGQVVTAKPVIELRSLKDRQFSGVVVMAAVVAVVSYGTAFVLPQFLAGIADYNAVQSGKIVMLAGIPMGLMMPVMPLLLRKVNIRVAVAGGMLMLALSSFLDTDITVNSDGAAFALSQILRGIGTILSAVFLNQAAVRSVSREQAADAAGLYNAARNLGGSLALASLGVLQEHRVWLHSRRLEESIHANSVQVQDFVAQQTHAIGSHSAVLRGIEGIVQMQAAVISYADVFWLLSIGIVLVIPCVFLLRPLPDSELVAAH
jgi:DHA2 family multidrug resistance protein